MVKLRARPGKINIQGDVSMNWAACPVSILPQEGVRGSMSGPRNYRPASVRMAVPNMYDIIIRKGAVELGVICFRITRQSYATMARADNT